MNAKQRTGCHSPGVDHTFPLGSVYRRSDNDADDAASAVITDLRWWMLGYPAPRPVYSRLVLVDWEGLFLANGYMVLYWIE